ncbi:MAG: PadR family transcriptional regulator [Polyangiaceae bacterium]|jgi:DNA-binding PadR family transcriptional regulator|nr:PadR family transcriptional regulator [Polyangiaceae bacterium]
MRSLSAKEGCVLELLAARGQLYGLELVGASGGSLKRGTVYVTLARMEEKGLVSGEVEPCAAPHPGLPRRLYRATALGLRLLEAQRAFAGALAGPAKVGA